MFGVFFILFPLLKFGEPLHYYPKKIISGIYLAIMSCQVCAEPLKLFIILATPYEGIGIPDLQIRRLRPREVLNGHPGNPACQPDLLDPELLS